MNDEPTDNRVSTTPSVPSEAIVLGIAERTGEEPTTLPPLYETVDPDALNALARDGSCNVTFRYADYEVTVAGPDHITIHETASARQDDSE